MNTTTLKFRNGLGRILLFGAMLLYCGVSIAQSRLPYEVVNNTEFADDQIFIAVVGEIDGGFVWVDPTNGRINPMSPSDNTVQGPVIDGNRGPGLNGRYANCFRKFNAIPNRTINIPPIEGCRIYFSFKSQLFFYFFGSRSDPRGYTAPNIENPTDPNNGISYEIIELTLDQFGVFNNTSRVDSYNYPIGLEVTGQNFFKRVGEIKTHQQILDRWAATAPPAFQGLYKRDQRIIKFPTKDESFPKNYLDGYINGIWNKYRSQEIYFNSGDAGRWRGRVQGNNFVFRRESDGQVATISGKPTTLEAMEGSGIMARGQRWDLVIQAQFVAAITRHAIDLNSGDGQFQDFGDASRYYKTEPYNWYAKFLHQTDISFEGQTYAFAYDDVFNQSATISTGNPIRAKVTLGGYPGLNPGTPNPPNPPANTGVTLYEDCPFAGPSQTLQAGRYTLGQLRALGVRDDQVSSLRVAAGFTATLYFDDNFAGRTLVKTSDDNCLVDDNFNDKLSSLVVTRNGGGGGGGGGGGFSRQIEAESFAASNAVQTEPASEGGLNVGYLTNGSWLIYDVNIPSSGSYKVEYRVASAVGGGKIQLEKAGGTAQYGTIDVPNTGGWQTWRTISQTVTLPAGQQQIAIYVPTAGYNLNWFKISSAGNASLAARDQDAGTSLSVYPNPASNELNVEGFAPQASAYRIFDLTGRSLLNGQTSGSEAATRIDVSSLPAGLYILEDRDSGSVVRFTKE